MNKNWTADSWRALPIKQQPDYKNIEKVKAVEDTLGGLRFVRNQMSPGADQFGFIRPAADQPHQGDGRVAAWTWNQLTEPSCESLSPDGKQWELGRYRAYQTRLAGHPVGETFGRASAFLDLAAAQAARLAENLSR